MQVHADNFSDDYVRFVSEKHYQLELKGVQRWVRAALNRNIARNGVIITKHLLTIAYHVTDEDNVPPVDLADVVELVHDLPRAACRLLLLWHDDAFFPDHVLRLVETLVDWMNYSGFLHNTATTLLERLSAWRPADFAAVLRSHGGAGLELSSRLAENCLWELVPDLLVHINRRQGAREGLAALAAADLPRFVREGLFTAGIIMGPISPPEFAFCIPVNCVHTLAYHMVEWNTVPHVYLDLFEKMPTFVVLQIATDYPVVARDVAASYNWLRRRAFLLAMARLATQDDAKCDPALLKIASDPVWWGVRRIAEFV